MMKKLNLLLSLAICCMLSLTSITIYSEYPIEPYEHTHFDTEKY